MYILRAWRCGKLGARRLCLFQQFQPLGDRRVPRIQLRSSSVRINSVRNLVVATLVQTPEVKPNLRDIGVYTNSTRISVQGIPVLVDLEVKDTNGAPESGVAAITIHSLLIGLVCLVVFLTCHVGAAKEVPALGVVRISLETPGKIGNRGLLVLKRRSVLVVKPAKLLKDFSVVWIISHNPFVRHLGIHEIILLLMHVPDLEPDVRMGEGVWGALKNPLKAAETFLVLATLLINDAQSEQNLVGLVKV